MRKPNWTCANCGMYPSRNSVKRHIQNIHSGSALYVSFVDYLAGRKSGLYWPSLPPTYQKKNNETNKVDYLNIMSEVFRQCIRQKIGTPNLTNNSNLFQKYFGE